jgi:hypothetical protein
MLLFLKSHRQTSVLGTNIHSGTSTEGIQSIPRVVPTVPPVMLVDPHSDCQELPSINVPVGGMGTPTEGERSTLLNPQVGTNSGLDGRGGTVHHVTEHGRAGMEVEDTDRQCTEVAVVSMCMLIKGDVSIVLPENALDSREETNAGK